jgi:adenylate kinase family enzyme
MLDRIVILGCAGSGKTTLAKRICEATGSTLICLDSIWRPMWTDADVPRFREILTEAHGQDRWVSDGNFATATFDVRLPRATLILWLERPRSVCVRRAILRPFSPDEPHSLRDLWKVLKFVWNFNRRNRPLIEKTRLASAPGVPVRVLRTDEEVDRFVDQCRIALT